MVSRRGWASKTRVRFEPEPEGPSDDVEEQRADAAEAEDVDLD